MKRKTTEINVVGIIPARSGSKGVPGKNIKPLLGKPLIAYSITEALKARTVDRVIVSTDSRKIAAIAEKYGAEVPFLRPKRLAGDKTPDLPVLKHVINYLEKKEKYRVDVVVHLRPTLPLRLASHIDEAVNKLIKNKRETVRSVSKVGYHPYWMKVIKGGRVLPFIKTGKEYNRRQDLPSVYKADGLVDVIRRDVIIRNNRMHGKNIYPVYIEKVFSFDIDTLLDFEIVEFMMRRNNDVKSKNRE